MGEQLRHAGAVLSNCAFNLAQRKPGEPLTEADIRALDESRRAWDAALSTHHAAPGAPQQCQRCEGRGTVVFGQGAFAGGSECPECDGSGSNSRAAATAPAGGVTHINALQALEALDELESSARGDEPFNHHAAPLIRQFIESATAARAAEPEGWKLVKVERLNDIAKYAADPSKECYLGRNLYDDRAVQDNWRACQSNLETIADEVRAIIEDWDKDELQEALAASPTPPTGTSQGEGTS